MSRHVQTQWRVGNTIKLNNSQPFVQFNMRHMVEPGVLQAHTEVHGFEVETRPLSIRRADDINLCQAKYGCLEPHHAVHPVGRVLACVIPQPESFDLWRRAFGGLMSWSGLDDDYRTAKIADRDATWRIMQGTVSRMLDQDEYRRGRWQR